jgi:chromosome partitioning protein
MADKREPLRTIAVTNQKGGSGKTTTAVNLAAALGERGYRTLVVDLDPQHSASSWLAVVDDGQGLLDVFTGKRTLVELVRKTTAPGVDIVTAGRWLLSVEPTLAVEPGKETLFRRALSRLPADRWSFVLVDCPPSLGLLVISALAACDEVLVPVEAHVMALAGLAALTETVERVRERLNPGLNITAIVACRVDARTNLAGDVVERLRERFGDLVLKAVVRENVRLAEAPSFMQPITLYAPDSAGAVDYRAVAKELVGRRPSRPRRS